ncbi:MAG TPA: T9SS type A sorting domain-containing protein [Bacteroidetes bacterium]|nr:T9SS type A sorting domain-containing protein [Bacteroidota bacterium]
MKKIFTYILPLFMLAATVRGQNIELLLNAEKDCSDRSYCVDIQVKKGSPSGADFAIGTSSILLTYDAEVLVFKNYFSENFDGSGACTGWSAQGYDAISRKGEIDLTLVLEQNGNACPAIGNDPLTVGRACFDIVQQGASPNLGFDASNTQFNANETDDGTGGIAVSATGFIDETNILNCDCPGTGAPCDDGNIYTVNDRFDVYCHCLGEYLDGDEDGILDGVDACFDEVYEAEDATLHEVAFRNNQPQYSGLGFVDYLHSMGDYIEFEVNVLQEGMHQLAFRYALETGSRPLELTVDGAVADPTLDFLATGAWSVWDTTATDYFLLPGSHLIRLTTIGLNGANLDQLILSFCSGCAETGLPCDDGDPCTIDDIIGADCNCGGKYEDTDFDGVCNVFDQCEGHDDLSDTDGDGIPDGCDDCDSALAGTPCDDGDPCTINDRYLANCECLGTFTGPDSDGDGVCDEYDICPAGNDALDADGDGIPDACDPCNDRLTGTPCDDGDPCTLLDITTADCGCQGFFFDSDGDGVCSALDGCEGFDDTIDNDGDGTPDACDGNIAISQKIEVGKVFGVGDAWQVVALKNTYQSMVVVATTVLPGSSFLPVVTRVRNAEGSKFEIRVQNPGGPVNGAFYEVQYVVAEEGVYTEAEDGFKMEARKELSVETARAGNFIREQRGYLQSYSNPVVVGQVMTFNDGRWSVFWSSRHNNSGSPADSTGFAAGKQIAEDTITARLDETVGFLVIEAGNYSKDGLHFEARLGENSVLGVQSSLAGVFYQLELEKANHAVLSASGINGGNGGWPVLMGGQPFRGNAMYLAFDEDQILDTERAHIAEEVSYFAFEFVQPLAIAAVEAESVSCHGGTDGAATVAVAGGEAPYAYLWSNGATAATANGLAAGTYGVTVTDGNGTELMATATVEEPPVIGVNMQGSGISCFGENDGYVLVISTGGTGRHDYLWSNGLAGPEISDLPAGNYTLTITDENACTAVASYEVTEPQALLVSASANDVSCFGGNDGAVSTSFTGGTGNQLSYLWSNGATAQNLSGLSAGTYTVTATDGNGCSAFATVEVGQPMLLEIEIATTFTSCNGGDDGTATASVSGGTGDVTYLWDNGATTATIENLPTGTYAVTATDGNGCTAVASANVTDPAMLDIEIESTGLTCFAVPDGRATASVSGGTGDVTYLWSNGATTATIENLSAGTYTVTVTDGNGCAVTTSVEVAEPPLLSLSVVPSAASCEEVNNGALAADAAGGTPAYSYMWSTGDTTAGVAGLFAGEYSLTVTDQHGCEAISTDTVLAAGELLLDADLGQVSCFGGGNGAIEVFPAGTMGPFTFEWSDSTFANGPVAEMLAPGDYTVTVTDNDGCRAVGTFTIAQPEELQITVEQVTAALGNNADGAIDISVSGGTAGYSFQWFFNNDLISEEEDLTDLLAGEYTLALTDANGCGATLAIEVESVTSAEERHLSQHIRLSPNPTSGAFSLFLDLPNNKKARASLFDVLGRAILLDVPVAGRYDFDLTGGAAGVYLLQVKVGEVEVAKRVVVGR